MKALHYVIGFMLVIATGCTSKSGQGTAMEMPPQEVGVVTVTAEDLPVVTELPGRIDAVRAAQVRARATGILLKRNFDEGVDVKEGDLLFEIDPAQLQAVYDSAKANLAKADAVAKQAKIKADRFKELVAVNAVSQQEFDDAKASLDQATAELESAKAALATAQLNLSYTKVTAPISGRIGTAKVTEGALVSQNDATELAVISQLDPIYFDFTQSSAALLKLKKQVDAGQFQSIAPGEVKVDIILEDGTVYPQPGKLLFSGVTVDPSTGMVLMRAEIPNPDHVLLPGMFVRGRLEQAVNTKAIAVTQRGIILGAEGKATAMVVADGKVEARAIKISTAVGDKWIVTEGLKPGDQVIVEGLQKIRPGAPVKPVPFKDPSHG